MDAERATCPTCGPTDLVKHPRVVGILRCSNCAEWLRFDLSKGGED